MKELVKQIKYNRLPKEVSTLLNILNDVNYISVDGQSEYNKSICIMYHICDMSYILFNVDASHEMIEMNKWNIMIVLDKITNRSLSKSYNLSDKQNAITAIQLSDFYSEYRIV